MKHKTGHIRQSNSQMHRKRDAISAKRMQKEGLEALIEMWEAQEDWNYVRHLKYRLNEVKGGLKAMGGL